MGLKRDDLKDKIQAALQSAKDDNWSLDLVAAAWADAIHAYVSAAEVVNVMCDVKVNVPITGTSPEHGTGTATQAGKGALQ